MHRIGHRGSFLLFLALLDVLYGYSLWVTPPFQQIYNLSLSWTAWGAIWVSAGVILLIGAFVRDDRVPFAVASSIKAAWAAVWFKIWVLTPHVLPRAWVSVVIWLSFSALVGVISTWPEGHRHPRVRTIQHCVEVPVVESDGISDDEEAV